MLRQALILGGLWAALSGYGLALTGAAGIPLVPVFAAFAAVAIWSTFADDDLRWVGIWLGVSFMVANLMHAKMHITSLPGPYAMIEVMILVAVAVAWDIHRNYWSLLLLGGINILSICFCVAFAAQNPIGPRHIYVFELTTNLCFAAECLLAIGAGLVDGYRTGRFTRLPWHRHGNLAANVARSVEAPE